MGCQQIISHTKKFYYVKKDEEQYLDIKVIIAPLLESGVKGRIKLVTSTFLSLQLKHDRCTLSKTLTLEHIKYHINILEIKFKLNHLP